MKKLKYKFLIIKLQGKEDGGFYIEVEKHDRLNTFEDLIKYLSKSKQKRIAVSIQWKTGSNVTTETVKLLESKIEEFPQYFHETENDKYEKTGMFKSQVKKIHKDKESTKETTLLSDLHKQNKVQEIKIETNNQTDKSSLFNTIRNFFQK